MALALEKFAYNERNLELIIPPTDKLLYSSCPPDVMHELRKTY